jgi:uncharacterized protein (TIGR02246 family)
MSAEFMTVHNTELPSEVRVTVDAWRRGINENDLDLIASCFSSHALFQGLRPEPLFGPEGVKEYYGQQPQPLTVEYEVVHYRELSPSAGVAYLRAAFSPAGRERLTTHVTLVLEHQHGRWLISHYHVSVVP